MERNNTDTNTQLPTTVSIAASTVVVARDNTVANGTSTGSSSTNNDASGAGSISTSTNLNTTATLGPVHQEHTLVVQMMELGIEKSLVQVSVVAANYESVDAAMSLLFGDSNNTNDNAQQQQQNHPGTTIAPQPPPHLTYYQVPLQQFYEVTIVVREDLRMSPGKIAAQTCHAVLAASRTAPPAVVAVWESQGEPVIILSEPTRTKNYKPFSNRQPYRGCRVIRSPMPVEPR